MAVRRHAAEYVLPGHPDKLCDAIADALVQEAIRLEPRALCGVEVAVHRASVFVTGRIACRGAEEIDVGSLVRAVYSSAGYGERWFPDPAHLTIQTDLCLGPLSPEEAAFRTVADDQSIVTGYAVDLAGTNYLPPEHWLAYRLARRFEGLRTAMPDLRLGPDGKLAVLLVEDQGSYHLSAFNASLQQALDGPGVELHRATLAVLRQELQRFSETIPGFRPDVPEEVTVNGAGNFIAGGPEGDNGLSGKKLVVDAYGPRVAIGGGALSGKDFFKADRAGAIIARRFAKAAVMTGVAAECTCTLAFFPGDTEAGIVAIETQDHCLLDGAKWSQLLDRTLAGVGERYGPGIDLVDVARRGHFVDVDRPWEFLGFDRIGI